MLPCCEGLISLLRSSFDQKIIAYIARFLLKLFETQTLTRIYDWLLQQYVELDMQNEKCRSSWYVGDQHYQVTVKSVSHSKHKWLLTVQHQLFCTQPEALFSTNIRRSHVWYDRELSLNFKRKIQFKLMESNGTLIKQYFDCFMNQLCFKTCINSTVWPFCCWNMRGKNPNWLLVFCPFK